jgi:hypothetical protein
LADLLNTGLLSPGTTLIAAQTGSDSVAVD